jgi:enoyl-CoA hydratase/carnithine racemase
MLLLNPKIPAKQALEWGLVNRVVPSVSRNGVFMDNPTSEQIDSAHKKKDGWTIDLSRLDETVAEWTRQLKEKFPECSRYTKTQTNALKEFVWSMTVGHAQDWLSTHFGGIEPWEGMRAFVEKRKPDFSRVRRTEFLWGPPTKQCRCGASGIPEEFAHCGRCGAKL